MQRTQPRQPTSDLQKTLWKRKKPRTTRRGAAVTNTLRFQVSGLSFPDLLDELRYREIFPIAREECFSKRFGIGQTSDDQIHQIFDVDKTPAIAH